MDDGVWYNGYMTNTYDRILQLQGMGYSTREIDEVLEHESKPNKFLNALGFIVESIVDNGEDSEFGTGDIKQLDEGSFNEFAAIYNFDKESFDKAMEQFEKAVLVEIQSLEGR